MVWFNDRVNWAGQSQKLGPFTVHIGFISFHNGFYSSWSPFNTFTVLSFIENETDDFSFLLSFLYFLSFPSRTSRPSTLIHQRKQILASKHLQLICEYFNVQLYYQKCECKDGRFSIISSMSICKTNSKSAISQICSLNWWIYTYIIRHQQQHYSLLLDYYKI